MKIKAIILDGFHKGHVVYMDYMPTVRLLKPKTVLVDYCCGGDVISETPVPESITYQECFRAVDQQVVLYSEKGKSLNFFSWFNAPELTQTPWNEFTTLYMGYHNEPIIRKEDGTQMTEFEKGFEAGVLEGRILQEKERKY